MECNERIELFGSDGEKGFLEWALGQLPKEVLDAEVRDLPAFHVELGAGGITKGTVNIFPLGETRLIGVAIPAGSEDGTSILGAPYERLTGFRYNGITYRILHESRPICPKSI
tara:strand:+ start:1026 stop:1364 length:339 start_codon:yes stop_codon:yes gene_type:complete